MYYLLKRIRRSPIMLQNKFSVLVIATLNIEREKKTKD